LLWEEDIICELLGEEDIIWELLWEEDIICELLWEEDIICELLGEEDIICELDHIRQGRVKGLEQPSVLLQQLGFFAQLLFLPLL
jgi:hypothetical protein